MMNLYQEEVLPLMQQLSQNTFDDLISITADNFVELRNHVRKRHFGKKKDKDIRDRTIKLAACCMVIAGQIDKDDRLEAEYE